MQWFRLILAISAIGAPAFASDRITAEEYRSRRNALRKETGDAVTILFGATEREAGEIRTGFFQDENFYYLTGWTEPGAILVLTPGDDILLVPKRNPADEKWTGPKQGPDDSGVARETGVARVVPAENFEATLPQWVESASKIYLIKDSPSAEAVKRLLPLRVISDASLPIARLRMKKSAAEIAAIQHSTDATIAAHLAAWRSLRAGMPEYQIAAIMTEVYFAQGCERHAYAPIVGSGPNGAILHYSKNKRTVDAGDLVLMDVAGECSMYATDITRTVPVNGKFSPRQKELYEIVLGAQQAVIDAIKPGMTLGKNSPNSLNKIAVDYFNAHGKDLHGKPLGAYFTHGIGHHVGLDVHDPRDTEIPLAANMVVTVEPGLYIPEEGIGIRIEDVVLVTDNGGKLMSSALPREPSEIEKVLAHRK